LVPGKNAVINNEQFGSRKNRSTNDGQVILKSEIQEAFANKQHLGAISLEL
jgi:hypothetical protein